jgi:hypothetical protein
MKTNSSSNVYRYERVQLTQISMKQLHELNGIYLIITTDNIDLFIQMSIYEHITYWLCWLTATIVLHSTWVASLGQKQTSVTSCSSRLKSSFTIDRCYSVSIDKWGSSVCYACFYDEKWIDHDRNNRKCQLASWEQSLTHINQHRWTRSYIFLFLSLNETSTLNLSNRLSRFDSATFKSRKRTYSWCRNNILLSFYT